MSCHREIGFAGGTTLPPQDHHTHSPLQGIIRWRLIVWADHNPKSIGDAFAVPVSPKEQSPPTCRLSKPTKFAN